MKTFIFLVLLLCSPTVDGTHWAFLVAGSQGYSNYRHQANVCHAYQLMLQSGISKDNIVTMMMDDVAYNPRNPFQGNIINEFDGPNVYKGVRIDYRDRDVTAENFIKVLKGIPTEEGSGRVIESKEGDHIFVYYSDHGNRNLLAFPGGMLYASQLNQAITDLHKANKFSKMVIYIEACHSGSMFYNKLPKNVDVYAMTAANPWESSYSCCYDRTRHTFLGDDFSGSWLRDSEQHNMGERTLWDQYTDVKRSTRMSHVSIYGDSSGMGGMKIGEFQSNTNLYKSPPPPPLSNTSQPLPDLVYTWDVPYYTLLNDLKNSHSTKERLEILKEIERDRNAQTEIRKIIRDIASQLTSNVDQLLQSEDEEFNDEQERCYEASVDKYVSTCSEYKDSDYFIKDLNVFGKFCTKNIGTGNIIDAIEQVCSSNGNVRN